ncbi:MAG: hypothetical protein BGP01_00350 [Paludibacter sp. 47-17]|nr:MAG: hypothetical protein ABS72_01525 [Paludibacter sp. SCN 50-10]OJX90098.1 MAG: hypothetical protein BGP01_00350 [Paludibacter sp. 47-17]
MSLDYTTAQQAYQQLSETRLTELRTALLKAAVRYAAIRAEWHFMSPSERATADHGRTIAHNRFIDTCNILSREQAKIGEDNKWRAAIGMDRKMIGDFACWVSCWVGIGER